MAFWQKLILCFLALLLLLGVILGWGSAGSALCAFCLLAMGAALLIKHFLIDRQNDAYDTDG